MLHDQVGKKMKALDVFTAAIKYMREFLLDLLIKRGAQCKLADNEISWIITVPAIWNNAAKQLMRKAAEKVTKGQTKLKGIYKIKITFDLRARKC